MNAPAAIIVEGRKLDGSRRIESTCEFLGGWKRVKLWREIPSAKQPFNFDELFKEFCEYAQLPIGELAEYFASKAGICRVEVTSRSDRNGIVIYMEGK